MLTAMLTRSITPPGLRAASSATGTVSASDTNSARSTSSAETPSALPMTLVTDRWSESEEPRSPVTTPPSQST